jgi:hypothetical protein
MFTFIHTSDWHLGQNFYGYDRSEEQGDFLSQLADLVRKRQPDALLVSGDIFHTAAPSSAAVNLYVNAMLDIHKACTTMEIIVIAGNHDSASRLDSDQRLWRLANVRVLGGISRNGNGQADLTGEFMFGVTLGYEIRNGKLGKALLDTTVSGIAFDMLKTVDMVSNRVTWSSSGFCGKKQPMPVGMGGPDMRCRITIGGR